MTCRRPGTRLATTGRSRPLVVAAIWLLAAASAGAESVSYVLTPQPQTGRIRVELTWTTGNRPQSALSISPQWGTVENVPGMLKNLQVTGTTDVRADAARWVLRHPPNATVTCQYEVDPGRRTLEPDAIAYPVTTRTFFHGMGNAFLLVPNAGSPLPDEYDFTLRWKLPEGWTAVCSWGRGPHVGARLGPGDVRHSVYVAGKLATQTVTRDGREVTVALLDSFGFKPAEFADLAATIVKLQCEFMSEQSFPPFLVTAVPAGEPVKPGDARLSGMGLYHSFALVAAPQSRLTDAFENLFAHELFHYWNGGVLKAQQPHKQAYWFIEGFTDYYAWRILYEAGHWPAETYAKWLNRSLRAYARNPAIHATNAEIAERYYTERSTVGEVAYQRGALLGLRWHKLARDRGVRDGLDRLFKGLVERGRSGFEVSNESIREFGISTLGAWFGPEFDQHVTQAQTVDVPADALAPGLVGKYPWVYEFELGFERERSLKERKVLGLVPGSAALRAGLRDGDELLGWTIPGDADQPVELQIKRGEQVDTIRYRPRGERTQVLQFSPARAGRKP